MEFRESNSSSGRKSKALLEDVTTYRTIPGSCEYVESGLLFLFFSVKNMKLLNKNNIHL